MVEIPDIIYSGGLALLRIYTIKIDEKNNKDLDFQTVKIQSDKHRYIPCKPEISHNTYVCA